MGVWWREERGEIHLTRDKQGNERILIKEEAEREKRGIAEEKAKKEANARRIAEEKAKEAEKKAKEAEANALQEAIFDLCELLSIELTEAQRAQVEAMDLIELRELRSALKQQKCWPG